MSKKVSLLLTLMLIFATTLFAASRRFTLVIDAGHGGHDTGALGAISKEKTINLDVALAFGRYVENNCPDVKVIYTRKTDVFIPLKERANIANRNGADLFISVHTNALPAGKIARGFETYTLGMHRAKDNLDVAMRENSVISMEKDYKQTYEGFDPRSSESYIMFEFIQGKNMEKSVDLARMIQNSVCTRAYRPDKGVHQAGFLVLRETSMPSCLIELGFITTPDEENLLNDDNQIDAIAKAIYLGFKQYKDKYDSRLTVPYRSSSNDTPVIPQVVPKTYKNNEPSATSQTVRSARKQPVHKETKPERKAESKSEPKTVKDAPVFKLQILASSRELRKGDAHFKGEDDFGCFKEDGMYKYTIGSSTNYNEINRLRKAKQEKFPESFIIAFKNGDKMDIGQAIKEFLQNKKK